MVPVLLQTSLVLWLAQLTLQGGVKPQSVSWGRVLPARGVGIGVKPGVGALGAMGNRYGSKAMKTGIGRFPGAHLGVGGYRALGLGGRAGLKPGYGAQGAYGANLGAGMGLGTGLTNGLGLGLGQGGKRAYGAGAVPGYGALAGIGYPGARPGLGLGYPTGVGAKELKPGVPTADLGGPDMAELGHAVEDPKSRALGPYGTRDGALGPDRRRDSTLGSSGPESQAGRGFGPVALPPGRDIKNHRDPVVKSSSLGPPTPLDQQGVILAVSQARGGDGYEPVLSERRGAAQVPGGVGQQQHLGPASPQVQTARNCNRQQNLGSETPRLMSQPHVGQEHLGAQGERTHRLPPSQNQDVRSNVFSPPSRDHLSAVEEAQGVRDPKLAAKDKHLPRIRGRVAVESHRGSSLNPQAQRGGSFTPLIPAAAGGQHPVLPSVGGQEAAGLNSNAQGAQHLSHPEHELAKSEALGLQGQTGRNNHATSYMGGAGNYLGGYGAGLGQGAYLGGAAGKLGAAAAGLGQGGYPQGVAGISNGYGDGATGYLGAMAGNGYGDAGSKALAGGYGNGYGDTYGAGLGFPAELADGAENKAGKSGALGAGGYAGQTQGAYGALGAGLESTGGKYGGGAAQVPYGNAPVIPAGLEGDGGYPYAAQQLGLGAEGAKAASKFGAGAGYGAQQTGYGAQLGATQDALGEQPGKFGGVNGALGNGYKG